MNISSACVFKQENNPAPLKVYKNLNKLKSRFYYQNVPDDIRKITDINGTDQKILRYLLEKSFNQKLIRLDSVAGRWESNQTIADNTGLHVRTVKRSKKRLEAAGYIRLFLRFWKGKRASDYLCLTHKTVVFFQNSIKPDLSKVKRVPVTPKNVSLSPKLNNSSELSRDINNITQIYSDTSMGDGTGYSESELNEFLSFQESLGQASYNSQPHSDIAHEPKEKDLISHCQSEDSKPSQCHSEDRPPNKLKQLFDRLKKACPQAKGDLDHFWYLQEFHSWKISRIEKKICEIEKYPEIAGQVYGVGVVFTMVNKSSRIYKMSGVYPPDRELNAGIIPEILKADDTFTEMKLQDNRSWKIDPEEKPPEFQSDGSIYY